MTQLDDIQADVEAIQAQLAGITSLLKILQAMANSTTPDPTAISELRGVFGAYDPSLQSLQAGSAAYVSSDVGTILSFLNSLALGPVTSIQAGSTASAIIGDNSLSSVNDFYRGTLLLTSGGANGQGVQIASYVGATRTFIPVTPLVGSWSVGDSFLSVRIVAGGGGGSVNKQDVRDAMLLAPTPGTPAAGSIDQILASIMVSYAAVSNVLGTATNIIVKRGNTWAIGITGLGNLTGYTSLWFTAKSNPDDADSAAVLQIKKNASGTGDGLLYLDGVDVHVASSALGSITINDINAGNITIALDKSIAAQIFAATYYQDVQALITGTVTTPSAGNITVQADVTRAIA